MKKFIVILLTVLLISSFVTPASAAQITEHVFNQDVTCYVAASRSLTASGNTPRLGYVAVHPKEWGNGSVAIVPFGAIITTICSRSARGHRSPGTSFLLPSRCCDTLRSVRPTGPVCSDR